MTSLWSRLLKRKSQTLQQLQCLLASIQEKNNQYCLKSKGHVCLNKQLKWGLWTVCVKQTTSTVKVNIATWSTVLKAPLQKILSLVNYQQLGREHTMLKIILHFSCICR